MKVLWLVLLVLPASAEAATWYRDADGDGYGTDDTTTTSDAQPEGFVATGGDCDDTLDDVHPDADERCDGHDNDCDGLEGVDDPADLQPWFIDGDGDGAGVPDANPYRGCTGPQGRVDNDGDCDDADPNRAPGIGEVCNDLDDDCDEAIDEDPALPFTFYGDEDGDGYGSSASGEAEGCEPPEGFSWTDDDCDDASTVFHPYAFEACTPPLADTNCDGSIGDADGDLDGVRACEDCDDRDPSVHPGAPDTWYDGRIQDCDHASDFDRDGDGHDDDRYEGDDCDDGDETIHPGAEDVPSDAVDQDCDGQDAVGTGGGDDSDLDTDAATDDVSVKCQSCSTRGPAGLVGLPVLVLLTVGLRRRR